MRCWGRNEFGQLGDGTTTTRLTPVMVSGFSSGAVAVVTGYYYSCALTTAGGVWCWGQNENGQLGDGTTTNRSTPVAVSMLSFGAVAVSATGFHTCALMSDGEVQCWGYNAYGQIGDGTTAQRTTPVVVSGLDRRGRGRGGRRVPHLRGVEQRCGAVLGVQLQRSGRRRHDDEPRDADDRERARGRRGGHGRWRVPHVRAEEQRDGAVLGLQRQGQLGDGTTTDRSSPGAVSGLESGGAAVDTGWWHTCALTTGGAA